MDHLPLAVIRDSPHVYYPRELSRIPTAITPVVTPSPRPITPGTRAIRGAIRGAISRAIVHSAPRL